MSKHILIMHSETKMLNKLKINVLYGLFCYSRRRAKLNRVTKQITQKHTITEEKKCFNEKSVNEKVV